MEDYTVYFDIYGKKLKTTVQATDEIHAMEIVKSAITVLKVDKGAISKPKSDPKKPESKSKDDIDDLFEIFDDFMSLFDKKK